MRNRLAAARETDPRLLWGMAAAAVLWALLWVLLPVWSDAAPSSDNVEQLVWSQGFELGYHKHPPLPTWILIAAEQFFRPSLALTYALSIVGMLIGAAFLWRLVRELLGRSAAHAAVLATGCIAFYSYRAHIFNHNTVLIPFVYASAWAFLRAVRTGKASYWALVGVLTAGGLLTKYQFAVVLATFALIGVRLKLYRQPQAVRGALLAAGIAVLLLGPHIFWLVANDFPPLRYAGQTMLAHLGAADRAGLTAGFLLQQIRDALIVVVMLILAAALAWRQNAALRSKLVVFPLRAGTREWILILGFAPLALMVAVGLVGGVRLENHWGTTALQFAALPVLLWMRQRRVIPSPATVIAVFFLVQGVEAGYDISVEARDRSVTLNHGRVRAFDAHALARAVNQDWERATSDSAQGHAEAPARSDGPTRTPLQAAALIPSRAPLRFLVGSTTWSGFVSLYSPDHPQVLISGNPQASPWVSLESVRVCGAVYFEPIRPPAGAAVRVRGDWVAVDYSNAGRGQPLHIRWAVVPPGPECRDRQPSS